MYEVISGGYLHCYLCSHNCKIKEGNSGFCGVRKNIAGKLYSLNYGNPIAMQVDPVEKKPLYHFLPGTDTFSIATIGCNFRCGFCQNWQISQARLDDKAAAEGKKLILPEAIVNSAIRTRCPSISYTYTEPTIFFEYAYDIAKIAKENKLCNIFVTNGFMSKDAILMIKPYLDAANVDLKFFDDEIYKKDCSGRLNPVLDSIRLMKELDIWVEITTLIIPGENDSEVQLSGIAGFISGIDKGIPWHISRFFPNYEFGDRLPTEESVLNKAKEIGLDAGLKYIYLGNLQTGDNNTYCPGCKKLLVERTGFSMLSNRIKVDRCPHCNSTIPGKFVP